MKHLKNKVPLINSALPPNWELSYTSYNQHKTAFRVIRSADKQYEAHYYHFGCYSNGDCLEGLNFENLFKHYRDIWEFIKQVLGIEKE